MKITKTEEWQDVVEKHIKLLDEDGKREFAHTLIFDLALWSGYNVFEMVGILECVKLDLFDSFVNSEDDD